jgi:hypothetical protein
MNRFQAQRSSPQCTVSASSGSSILPGVVGSNLSAGFATFVAFNLVGAVDIILDYYHAVHVGLPALAGQLGATYAIPTIYVPVLMITHFVAFYWLVRPQPKAAPALSGDAIASWLRYGLLSAGLGLSANTFVQIGDPETI